MRKSLFALTLLPALAYANLCFGLDLMGPREPDPYAVFSTISAGSPGKGQAALAVSAEKSGNPDFYRFSSQFAIGLSDHVELAVNIPYVDNTHSGVEDMVVTLKHRFMDETKIGPSLAYLVTGALESSTEELSSDGGVGAGFIVSKRVGPVNGHLNFIVRLPGDDDLKEEYRFSAGMEFSAAHNFDILAEFFLRESYFSTEVDELEAKFGYRILYGNGVYTTIGAGFGLDDKAPDFRVMASLTLSFPRLDPRIEKVYEEGE